MSETKIKSLASKLAAIGKEIGAVDKSGRNTQQNYAYIEYGVVAGKIRELFDKYGIIIIPSVDGIQQDEITNKYGGKGYHYVLTMTFTLINGDDKEDREIATWSGEASDYGDKGINKAETAGTKYFLMRLFNVSEKGDEDADKNTPPEMVETAPKQEGGKLRARQVEAAKDKLRGAGSLAELKLAFTHIGSIASDPEVIKLKDELKAKLEDK